MSKFNKKITKYLNTQIFVTFFAFFVVISLIILGNQFFLVMSRSLSEAYLVSELVPLIFFKYIRDIPFVISFSFSLALIYSLNKLYKDSELIILTSCGFGDYKIFKILMPLIALVVFLVLILSLFVVPVINKKIDFIKDEANSRPEYIHFKEGIFQNFNNGSITLYADKIEGANENQMMKNIFLFSSLNNKVILSNTGEKIFDNKTNKVFLRLFDGKIYHNIDMKNIGDFSVSKFEKFEMLLYQSNYDYESKALNSVESDSIFMLIDSHDNDSFKELLYRLSISISLIIMSFLSIQFSKLRPRNTRNFALGYGLLSYIGYYNLLIYAKEIKSIDSHEIMLTFASAHIPFLFLVFIILLLRNNFSMR